MIYQTVSVSFSDYSYPIYVGHDILNSDILYPHIRGHQVLIVTQNNIAHHYLPQLLQRLEN